MNKEQLSKFEFWTCKYCGKKHKEEFPYRCPERDKEIKNEN